MSRSGSALSPGPARAVDPADCALGEVERGEVHDPPDSMTVLPIGLSASDTQSRSGVPRDAAEAARWYRRAVPNRAADARPAPGKIQWLGRFRASYDGIRARDYASRGLAEQGDADAQQSRRLVGRVPRDAGIASPRNRAMPRLSSISARTTWASRGTPPRRRAGIASPRNRAMPRLTISGSCTRSGRTPPRRRAGIASPRNRAMPRLRGGMYNLGTSEAARCTNRRPVGVYPPAGLRRGGAIASPWNRAMPRLSSISGSAGASTAGPLQP